jgi:hypothetical protein
MLTAPFSVLSIRNPAVVYVNSLKTEKGAVNIKYRWTPYV